MHEKPCFWKPFGNERVKHSLNSLNSKKSGKDSGEKVKLCFSVTFKIIMS